MREMAAATKRLPWVTSLPLTKTTFKIDGKSVPKGFVSQFIMEEPLKLKAKRKKSSKWIVNIFIEISKTGIPEIFKVDIWGSTSEIDLPPIWILQKYPSDWLPVDSLQIQSFNQERKKLIELATIDVASNWSYNNSRKEWTRNPRKPILNDGQQGDLAKIVDKKIHQKLDEKFLEEVANIYLAAKRDGLFPNREISIFYNIPKKTAERWVARCKEEGLLPKQTKAKRKEGK